MLAPRFRWLRLVAVAYAAFFLMFALKVPRALPAAPAGSCPPYPNCQGEIDPYYCCGTTMVAWGVVGTQEEYCLVPNQCS